MTDVDMTEPLTRTALVPVDEEAQARRAEMGKAVTSQLRRRKWAKRALMAAAAFAVLNYGVLSITTHTIDADVAFQPAADAPMGSAAVAMAAALVEREIDTNGWTPNDPWIAPAAMLDNMPNFQTGVVRAVGRFSFEMLDQIARTRGSSSADPDLERAAGFLQFPPDIWVFEPSQSLLPTVPSETQYRAGFEALQNYNARLARGEARFERRADTLATTLSRISAEMASQTAQIEFAQETGWWVFSRTTDDVFYQNKGMMYAYYMILTELGNDFAPILRERNMQQVWVQTMDSLRMGAQLRPTVVLNGDPDRSIFANHLAMQGFYLKRAILQLEEAVSVLTT